MIKKPEQFRTEVREKMRGGEGAIKIEHMWEAGEEMKSANRMAARLVIDQGCSIGTHRHDNEDEIFYIVQGCAEVNDNGVTSILSAGDTILTGNAEHAIKNIGDEPLIVIAMISTHSDKDEK